MGSSFEEVKRSAVEDIDRERTPSTPTRAARLEALLREINPYLDAVVCYASTINEHEPNRIVKEIRELLDSPAEVLPSQTSGAEAVGWMHPTARWFAPDRDTIAMHCTPDQQPVRVFALARPASEPAGGGDEFWTPKRISHVLSDCATYFRTLYKQHKIGPADRGIDPDKLDVASRAAALSSPASSSPAEDK